MISTSGKDWRRSLKSFSFDHNVTLDVTIPSAVAKFARSIPIRPIGTARRGIKVDLWFNRRLVRRPSADRRGRTSTSEPIFKGEYDRVRCSQVLLGVATSGVSRARVLLSFIPSRDSSSRLRFQRVRPRFPSLVALIQPSARYRFQLP